MAHPSDSHSLIEARTFDAKAVGSSLHEVGMDVIRGDTTDITSRWFHSSANSRYEADLVIWSDSEKRIIKQQLCFFGQIVEWSALSGTRTGFVTEEEIESLESEIIRYDSKPQAGAVTQALQIISGIKSLAESDRRELIFRLKQSTKLHKNALSRALAAWAPGLEQIRSAKRPGLWRRLSHWFRGE